MTADLSEASSEVTRDLSPEWLELSSRVRRLAIEAQTNRPESFALAESSLRLCDHVERLHSDVQALLVSVSESEAAWASAGGANGIPHRPEAESIDRANIEIQREMHQQSDLKHIIKALFMWKDDPVERVRDHTD